MIKKLKKKNNYRHNDLNWIFWQWDLVGNILISIDIIYSYWRTIEWRNIYMGWLFSFNFFWGIKKIFCSPLANTKNALYVCTIILNAYILPSFGILILIPLKIVLFVHLKMQGMIQSFTQKDSINIFLNWRTLSTRRVAFFKTDFHFL